MTNRQNIKNKDLKGKQNRVWLREGGIVCITLAKTLTEEDIWNILEDSEEKLRRLSGKGKVLINMSTTSVIRSSQFRKITTEKIKKIARDPGFEKAAIYGGDIVLRTIASFIIMTSGTKNIKIFSTEKEALKWLKKP